uniref:Leucine-rich repeat-containing protein 59 n=1 Tax=Tetraodon nigroviridis TaxID=99883 RepID=H3CMN5_TETNG
MSKNSKVLNLKDKINDKEMDLSLCNLSEVPVRELAPFTKVTVLDLSCNNLTSLPPEFCNLTHLVKVDLSKNQLTCLPGELGNLSSLQHLDLYNNKLTLLPVSFSQLRNLRWLDLKDNPLEPDLARAAGDCLDEKQCKQCASRVLQHMRLIQEEADRAREKRLLREKVADKNWLQSALGVSALIEHRAALTVKPHQCNRPSYEYNAQVEALAGPRQQTAMKASSAAGHALQSGFSAGRKVVPELPRKPQHPFLHLLLRLLLLLLLGLAGAAAVCHLTDMRKEAMCAPVHVAVDNGLRWAREREGALRQLLKDLSAAAK